MTRLPRPKREPIQWLRIYRQTLTLIHKNFLIFYTAPISTLFRALLFPLVAISILCSLRYLQVGSGSDGVGGFADASHPIRDLTVAMNGLGRSKLVFVANGTANALLDPLVGGIKKLPGMASKEVSTIASPDDLFDACKQSVLAKSECFAAVIFTQFDDTTVDYRIALDGAIADDFDGRDWKNGNELMNSHFFPLQWAINSHIGAIDGSRRPSTQVFSGSFGPNYVPWDSGRPTAKRSTFWVSIISFFVSPVFILALIGVIYHEATFVATERESSMAELMSSQEVTIAPRMLSTMVSFFVLYLPGFIGSSVIITQVLFTKTSDGLFLLLTILAGLSFVTSTHFLASFFSKANLAGLYSSTLAFALGLVSLAATMTIKNTTGQVTALALLFPPYTWVMLIADTAFRETSDRAFSLSKIVVGPAEFTNIPPKTQYLDGSLYLIFFLVQIIVYTCGTYLVERNVWGVERQYERIDATSDVALRCTSLTKTYLGKRRWYWPFSRKSEPLVAVDGLDLEVKKGSITFLLGPNGGGKTTTIKCIAGMTAMDIGSRLELNEDSVVFGICPQNNVFWRGLTVKQHVKIWKTLKTAARPSIADEDVIAECDLSEKMEARAETLSGGQMRKLQLAIAFCGGSRICCIDEASSGLDPLSRRAIWNIIQKGHMHRTVLITTHFLDEADVLANHIAIIYKGKMVCEGPSTTLKARYGDSYLIRNHKDREDDDSMVWRTSSSADATRKLLELESHDNDNTYDINFPTLEQVFLKVTTDTAIHASGGDGFVGELETTDVLEEKIIALEAEYHSEIDLDVGSGIGFLRQIQALFSKRYILLTQKAGWIAYIVNLAIPIIIAAAIAKFLRDFGSLKTCEMIIKDLRAPAPAARVILSPIHPSLRTTSLPEFYLREGYPLAILGPEASWTGKIQTEIYVSEIAPKIHDPGSDTYSSDRGFGTGEVNATYQMEKALSSRSFAASTDDIVTQITNYSGSTFSGFGIWEPATGAPVLFHEKVNMIYNAERIASVFNLLTNLLAVSETTNGSARRVSSELHIMRQPVVENDFRSLPIAILVVLAFIAATSIAVIYPAYERLSNVRSLHYCNGVTPAALWIGYLLFDIQFIIIQSVIVWGAMYAGNVTRLYYESTYLLGVFILFGIATYLGSYLISLYVRKAAFAIVAGTHIILLVLYLISYVIIEVAGDKDYRHATYSIIQFVLGLSSPAANLLRALLVAINGFGILCGQFANNNISDPMAYIRYGSPYANLFIQIVFLIACLAGYEYGSADFIRRNITHRGVPSRLHYRVESGEQPVPTAEPSDAEKTITASTNSSTNILQVLSVSKYFGKTFAVENVSFNIATNETLALLGGNGAGKTTLINMIRGSLHPNFGDILLDGISVLRNPSKTRLRMGVCPQDDAVDNLTVHQTLHFYAKVKGLKDVEGNVDKVLNALNITMYQELLVKALSGGTKRKLSVAIALLGNPRILLLDEPSTGQDAGAKRILWKALQNVSANRAILLTTHSMEEAEKLATSVAIMGTKMLATGTLRSLQESYGGTLMVRAVRAEGVDAEEVRGRVESAFEGRVKEYQDRHGQVTFGIPHYRAALGSIMKSMEELKGDTSEETRHGESSGGGSSSAGGSAAAAKIVVKCFSDYTINGPTLEEVFMNVARESGVTGEV